MIKTVKWCQLEVQLEHTSRKTGKTYKKWHFVGWSRLPELSQVEHTVKGKWVVVTAFEKLERYDISAIVEKEEN